MNQPLKSLTEFGPLVVFFALYKWHGIMYATGGLVIATLLAVAATYYATRKVPMMPLVTAIIVAFFGSLTIFSGNELFIKIKPTLVNLVFSVILLGGAMRGKGLLKRLFDSSLKMEDSAWREFSIRWGLFFLVLAGINEVVWRHFSTDIWVDFKVFGLLGLTFGFMLTQLPFLKRNMKESEL